MSNNSSGRPSAFKDEQVSEKYISIWIDQFYSKLPAWELGEKYGMSQGGIYKALGWVNKHYANKIPAKLLLEGSIFAIKERIRKMTKRLDEELEQKPVSMRSVVEANRELREDSRDLLKLQNLYKEKYDVTVSGDNSIKAILQALSKK